MSSLRPPILQGKGWSPPFVSNKFEETRGGYLVSKKNCLFIGSYGDKYPQRVKIARRKAIERETAFLPKIKEDIERFKSYCFRDPSISTAGSYTCEDRPGHQRPKEFYLEEISNFLQRCDQPGASIWYAGHGVEGSGDWVFNNGTISFSEIYELYEKYFHGKLLILVVDCCYSGQWVLRLAKYLTSQDIGACGHCARDRKVLIKVLAACLPHESAYDGVFTEKGILVDDFNHSVNLQQLKIEVNGVYYQTPCLLDSTKVCCSNSPEEKCNWPSIPASTRWTWNQLADTDQRRSLRSRIKFTRYLTYPPTQAFRQPGSIAHGLLHSRGRFTPYPTMCAFKIPRWQYVLVKSHLLKEFEDTQDGSDYGYVLCSGWGEEPPEAIIKKMIFFSFPV